MLVDIRVASSPEDYEAFARVFAAYEDWLTERFAVLPDMVARIRSHQGVDAELAALSERYGPPNGVALLAVDDHVVAGAVAYRDLGDGICEMKRLYVLDQFQGRGIGRQLCEVLVAHAAGAGFGAMRLDTGLRNTEALQLYGLLGFHEIAPYREYPPEVAPHLVFLERALP